MTGLGRSGPPVVALCNQKGGVGKSTTTYHLARAGVSCGLRVLVVDMDPQGNVTAALTAQQLSEDAPGVANALTAREATCLRDVIVDGLWPGLAVAPTPCDVLAVVRDELVVAGAGRERRLCEQLEAVKPDFDVVLIDCPPSLDQLTINALVAATGVVIVTTARLWSSNGLVRLMETISQVRVAYNPNVMCLGIVVNAWEALTRAGQYWHAELSEAAANAGLEVFAPPVPKRTLIGDAAEASMGLDEHGCVGRELAGIYEAYLSSIVSEVA